MSHIPVNAGDRIYKYELRSRIGNGGFGDVWLAHDHSIGRDVAVKLLDASRVTIDDRLKEAKIGNFLSHDNLVKVHYADVVEIHGNNVVAIAMDYHREGSIVDHLNAGNFLPVPVAVSCIIDALRGLEYLHEKDYYHGDIKPKNILVGPRKEGLLTDYGISCHAPNLAAINPANFYVAHAAPEVIEHGLMTASTDIYHMGLTAFRLMNGIGLIKSKLTRLGKDQFYEQVKLGRVIRANDYQPFIPRNLKIVINKAVSVNPNDRYATALEMRRALERLTYAGYWTCDPNGNLVGVKGNYTFRYEDIGLGNGHHSLTTFKRNKLSGRETRLSAFSVKRGTRDQITAARKAFIESVIST